MFTAKHIEYILKDQSLDIDHKIEMFLDFSKQNSRDDLILYLANELYLLSKDKDILNNYIKTLSDKIGVLENENRELSAYILDMKKKNKKKGKKKHELKDYDYQA